MRRITVSCLVLALILLGLTGLVAAQNVSIQLTPQGAPIQIPPEGGSFNYSIAATNNGATPQRATVWCMITLPNGNPYGPVLGPVAIRLSPGQTIERQRTQVIPAGFPAGNYSFNGYIGVYPDTVWDSDSFPFEKQVAGGTELWIARYDGPENNYDCANCLAVDADGNVYVTGGSGLMSSFDPARDYVTIKYNAAGVMQWIARYDGIQNVDDVAMSLAVDSQGNVYVTGWSNDAGINDYDTDYATIKYDAAGIQQWVALYQSPGNRNDEAYCIALDAENNVYVTGRINGIGTSSYLHAFGTIKYNANGVQQWIARYNGPGNDYDCPSSLAVDSAGNVYVAGGTSWGGTSTCDYATVKYNTDGVQQWAVTYNGLLNDYDWAHSIGVDNWGNVYVTGRSTSFTWSSYATVKCNPNGTQQWVAWYYGAGTVSNIATSLGLDAEGNVYVTGLGDGDPGPGTDYDLATVKYNTGGIYQWAAIYRSPGPCSLDIYSACLVVDAQGNVYVTGDSPDPSTGSDYATIKYNSSGQELWTARYDGPGSINDFSNSIALDGNGDVCVTGQSVGSGTGYDYCTIKYSGGNIANWMPVEATVFGQPLPQECRLEGNYPNPFNAETVLSYQLPVASHVKLEIFDVAGRLVGAHSSAPSPLVDGWRSAGTHELTFDASSLPSGIYFARLDVGDYVGVQKLILLK